MDILVIGIILVVAVIVALVAYGITAKGGEADLSEDVEIVDDPELSGDLDADAEKA